MKIYKLYVLLVGCLVWLTACNTQPASPKVVRIEVSPSALLLTQAGENQILTAKAFDAQGNKIETSITWSSSQPEVTVDATGKVTAMSDVGSAQITAEAEGVKSSPATVLVAQPVSGAVLVTDDQVLSPPEDIVTDQEPKVGSKYRVLLSTSQTPGAILISAGSQPIAGKVVSSTASGAGFEVVIERRPVTEVFNRISVRLQGSLAEVQPSFAGLAQPSQVQTLPYGTVKLSYAPSAGSSHLQPQVKRRIGPFECEAEAGIAPSDAGIDIQIQRNLNFDFVLETEFLEVKQFRAKVEGSMGVSANGKLEFGVLGLVELTCKAIIFRLPIPVTGPLAAIISPVAPLGLKFSASGELKSTFLAIELAGETKLDATVGIDYTPETGWVNLSSFETVAKDVTPKLLSLANAPITFEGKLGFQGAMGIGVGNTVAALEIIEVATGPVLEVALKPAPAQALGDEADASNYKLNWKTTAAPGEDLYEMLETVLPNNLVDKLKLVNLSFVEDIELSSSPTANDAITVDLIDFKTDDKLTFQVPLDPANLNFLPTFYNVGAIKIYRKDNTGAITEITSQTAADGQKDFTLEWIATEDGTTTDNFFAFVESKLLPFADLKLGKVVAKVCEAPEGVKYCVTDLGTLGVPLFEAINLNDNDQVVGWSRLNNIYHAFIWQNGQMTDLGKLNPGDNSNVAVNAINNNGQVVGSAYGLSGYHRAYLWQNGQMTDLGALDEETSYATDINDNGQVVGGCSFGACLWQNGQISDLGHLGGDDYWASWAYAINNSGQVVGGSSPDGFPDTGFAFLWQNGQMTNLGTLGDYSYATDINNNGQVVGLSATSDGAVHAFLWEDGQMMDLGTPDGQLLSAKGIKINDNGQVVGSSRHPIYNTPLAFIWQDRQMTDLNTQIDPSLGWTLSEASAINNNGQIVGNGSLNGVPRSFLLTPSGQ